MSDGERWTIINVDGSADNAKRSAHGLSDEQRVALLRVLSAEQHAPADLPAALSSLRALLAMPVPPAEQPAPEPGVTHCPCGVPCVFHSSDGSVPGGGKCSICPTDGACKGGRQFERVTDAELAEVEYLCERLKGSMDHHERKLTWQRLATLAPEAIGRFAAELRAIRALVSGGHEGDAAEHLKAAREALGASPGESICGAAHRARSSLASLRAPVDVKAEVERMAKAICVLTGHSHEGRVIERVRSWVRSHAHVERTAVLAREAEGLRTSRAKDMAINGRLVRELNAARAEVERLKAEVEPELEEDDDLEEPDEGEIDRVQSKVAAILARGETARLRAAVERLTKERDEIDTLREAGIEGARGVTSRSLNEPLVARVQRLIDDANAIKTAAQAVANGAEWPDGEDDGERCVIDRGLLEELDEVLAGKPR